MRRLAGCCLLAATLRGVLRPLAAVLRLRELRDLYPELFVPGAAAAAVAESIRQDGF